MYSYTTSEMGLFHKDRHKMRQLYVGLFNKDIFKISPYKYIWKYFY